MKKLRKSNKQAAAARRNSSNLVHIEAKITRKNEKLYDKAAKIQYKTEKKLRKVRMRQRAKTKAADQERLFSPGVSALLKSAAIILLLVALTRTGYTIYDLKQQEKQALALQQELRLQEKELTSLVSVKDTPEYIEQQARNVLHMIKPGEILYIPDPSAKAKNEPKGQSVSASAVLSAKPATKPSLKETDAGA